MESRKVQVSGGSTFIVSIPKRWAERNGLSAGTPLNITEDRNGNLVLSAQPMDVKDTVIGEIKLSGSEDRDGLMRRLVGAYVSGATGILVSSKGAIPPELARTVRDFTRLVMGVEIIEESKDLIRLQDLINPSELSVRTGLKRMAFITEKMVEDSFRGLKDRNMGILEDVMLRDMEVDRIDWLIQKEYNRMSQSPSTADKERISSEDALNFMLSSRYVERVADHAVSIAKYLTMIEPPKDKDLINHLIKEGEAARKVFSDGISSLFYRDLPLADSTIDSSKELRERLPALFKKVFQQEADEAVLLAYAINSIERIASYGGDIAKITLNTFVPKK